jgi:hypothetical protein
MQMSQVAYGARIDEGVVYRSSCLWGVSSRGGMRRYLPGQLLVLDAVQAGEEAGGVGVMERAEGWRPSYMK